MTLRLCKVCKTNKTHRLADVPGFEDKIPVCTDCFLAKKHEHLWESDQSRPVRKKPKK
jgi:hypothetical protein